VATDQTAKNRTKNAAPSATRTPGVTGRRGLIASLDEAGVEQRTDVGNGLDDPDLEEQFRGFLREGLQFAREELLVGGAVLPAQVGLRFLEGLRRLASRRHP
jgi:hypothetical protein